MEVVFFGRCHRRVRIRRTDHAEFIRVGADAVFDNEAALQSATRIITHLGNALLVLFDVFAIRFAELTEKAISEQRPLLGALYLDQVVIGFIVGEFIGR